MTGSPNHYIINGAQNNKQVKGQPTGTELPGKTALVENWMC